MWIDFEKWHGCKNDFIVTWMISTDKDTVLESLRRVAPRLCSRDGGSIGADGILVLEISQRKDTMPKELHIINADGSLAVNCGNGLRCAAKSVRRKVASNTAEFLEGLALKVKDHTYDCRFLTQKENSLVAITMPVPQVGAELEWKSEAEALFKSVDASKIKPDITACIQIGNPHFVIQCESLNRDQCLPIGMNLQRLQNHDGVNVHFITSKAVEDPDVKVSRNLLSSSLSELYQALPFERGVGFTQACGSGACAIGIFAYTLGMAEREGWIGVDMPGGRLYVRQDDENAPIILAGPAELAFVGHFDL
jgi:diaminopimelate epimerase